MVELQGGLSQNPPDGLHLLLKLLQLLTDHGAIDTLYLRLLERIEEERELQGRIKQKINRADKIKEEKWLVNLMHRNIILNHHLIQDIWTPFMVLVWCIAFMCFLELDSHNHHPLIPRASHPFCFLHKKERKNYIRVSKSWQICHFGVNILLQVKHYNFMYLFIYTKKH